MEVHIQLPFFILHSAVIRESPQDTLRQVRHAVPRRVHRRFPLSLLTEPSLHGPYQMDVCCLLPFFFLHEQDSLAPLSEHDSQDLL